VYTNGDICLDLLGKGWKPQLTVRTLAVSILSILSSAREKGIPPDNSNRKQPILPFFSQQRGDIPLSVGWLLKEGKSYYIAFSRHCGHCFLLSSSTDADNAPGKVQEGWLYHDDHC
jgi:hypothetical protein